MLEFFQSPAGGAVLGVFIAAVIVLLLDLNYRFFAKTFLDVVFAFVFTAVTSPVLAVLAVISRIRAGKVLESRAYLGVKGKIIYLHTFAGIRGSAKYFARLFDILGAKLSFVGVLPLEVADGALIDDKQMERFSARPGLICYLIIKGYEDLTFEDMFSLDTVYAKKRELFTDIFIVLKRLVYAIRGEDKSYLGEAEKAGFAQTLLNRGQISQSAYAQACKIAEETLNKNGQ